MEKEILAEVCDLCGGEAIGILGETTLCENCLHEASSCCGDG